MAGLTVGSFHTPDETRTREKTRIEVVRLGGESAGRFTFQPGWRWSEAIKPVAGTDSCQARHVGAVISGCMHVVHTDGPAMTPGSSATNRSWRSSSRARPRSRRDRRAADAGRLLD
jgi:hypothetical protein